jgi:hypothetical protein
MTPALHAIGFFIASILSFAAAVKTRKSVAHLKTCASHAGISPDGSDKKESLTPWLYFGAGVAFFVAALIS